MDHPVSGINSQNSFCDPNPDQSSLYSLHATHSSLLAPSITQLRFHFRLKPIFSTNPFRHILLAGIILAAFRGLYLNLFFCSTIFFGFSFFVFLSTYGRLSWFPVIIFERTLNEKSAKRRRKHCALAVVRQSQKLISSRWSLPLPTNPVWWGSMQAICSYRGNRPTHRQTNRQDRLKYTAPLSSARIVCYTHSYTVCTALAEFAIHGWWQP